jgi:glycosyltransferase involved in cell wall biosynthesis
MKLYILIQYSDSKVGVINGGSQSARNLLVGLQELGIAFTPVFLSQTSSPDGQPFLETVETEFGEGLRLCDVPMGQTWQDERTGAAILELLRPLPAGIFHLIEVGYTLGSWLWALRRLPFRIVFTALDYIWICPRSHLLTAHGSQCDGPRSATGCIKCLFNHRDLSKQLLAKVMLAASYLPVKGQIGEQRRLRQLASSRFNTRLEEFTAVHALIAPSQALADAFVRNGFNPSRVFQICYGTQAGTPISFSERPPLEEGIILGFVGKTTFDKGLDILLDTIEALQECGIRNLRLVIFASPHPSGYGQEIARRIARSSAWVRWDSFDGYYPHSIDAAHRRIHAQVAPSRWSDNLPNAVLEGLERNTPIIAPNQGSLPEMVFPGINGWLYDNTDALTELMIQLSTQPKRLLSMPFSKRVTRSPLEEARQVAEVYRQELTHI